jgi:hypothetical protein
MEELTTREYLCRFEYRTECVGLEELAPVCGRLRKEPLIEFRLEEVGVDVRVVVDRVGPDMLDRD